ncbi:recombinase family protein [Streptomyces sp. NPDC085596]|uniref:recombinase family protein n=1 Tax=Streptomyces sp. NPDC085596 TaxID=3365731 RepID=UPI0037D10EC1
MPFAPEYLHLVFPHVTFESLLYGRNSDDATSDGDAVEDQLESGRILSAQHNWHVRREFKDTGISASRHARKARGDFEELLEFIAEEAVPVGRRRIVVAYEASRYYRNLDTYVRLRAACIATHTLLCYNGQVYDLSRRDDRKITAQHAIDAEDEAEGIRDRNLRTARRTAQAGLPHGKSQFGYTRQYKKVKGRRRCIGQAEDSRGQYVVKAMQGIDEQHSLKSVVRWLNATPEAARPDGKEWTTQTARYMLLNRAYLGERLVDGQYVAASWPALKGLDTPAGRAMFHRVTAILTSPDRSHSRGSDVAHLLSHIGLCGECGDHAVLEFFPRTGRSGGAMVCKEKHDTLIKEAVIDAFVEQAVLAWFGAKEAARAALIPNDEKIAEMASAALRLVNSYEEQLSEARRLAGEFDEETGSFKLSAVSLGSMEAKIQPKLDAARKKLRTHTGVSPSMRRLLDADDLELVWNGRDAAEGKPAVLGLSLEQKREVIRAVVTVRLFKAQNRGSWKLDESRIRLSFVGEPGFRAQRLRVPAPEPVRLAVSGTE